MVYLDRDNAACASAASFSTSSAAGASRVRAAAWPAQNGATFSNDFGARGGIADGYSRRRPPAISQVSSAPPPTIFSASARGRTQKSRKHLEENVGAADIVLTADDLAEIDRIVPPDAASGTRYPIGQMHRLNR